MSADRDDRRRLPIESSTLMTQFPFRFLAPLLMALTVVPAAFALPADIEADRLVLAAQERIAQQDFDGAKAYLARVAPLKVEPCPVYHFLYGEVLLHEGDLDAADTQLGQYVTKVGRKGDHYDEALNMITQIEEQQQSRQDVANDGTGGRDLKSLGIEASDDVGKAYDAKVSALFMTKDVKKALVLQINSLLKSYPYLEGRVKNLATSDRETYSVSVEKPSELLVTKTQVNRSRNNGQAEISVSKINVFGVNPFVSYRCSNVADNCVVRNPVSGDEWIRIADDESGARELSTALTRLIKALQR